MVPLLLRPSGIVRQNKRPCHGTLIIVPTTFPHRIMSLKPTPLLLNIGHALDHMFLLIFATAVVAIAGEFGFSRWEDLMPYSVGAFLMFGLGSVPSGRLGDLWGRRRMVIVF